jgi:IS30 family transposase
MKAGYNQSEKNEAIKVHKSTISRKLRHNRYQRRHRPKQAHRMAMERRGRGRKMINVATWRLVEKLIQEDWSSEKISISLQKDHDVRINHE